MVVLNRIYTRAGDDGTTALGNGERRPKYDLRIAAYGSVDELNAVIGLARLHTRTHAEMDAMQARIQNDLFDLGADLCTPEAAKGKGPGGEIRLPAGGGTLRARATLASIVPVDHLEIIGDGKVVADLPLTGDRRAAMVDRAIPVRGRAALNGTRPPQQPGTV